MYPNKNSRFDYWNNINNSTAHYGFKYGSLFTGSFNLEFSQDPLHNLEYKYAGINKPYCYFGSQGSSFGIVII